MTKTTNNQHGHFAASIVVNPNLDTPTNVFNIAEWLQKPDLMTDLNPCEAATAVTCVPASGTDFQLTTGCNVSMGGGAITVLNPSTGVFRLPEGTTAVEDTDKIPVVVKEDNRKLPVPVVETNRKRTMITRSLSRQASENFKRTEEEEDSDWEPESPPPAKRGRRSVAGRKPNSAIGDGLDHLPADERDKVILRRQKNKEAAARCRQKRVDLTNSLAKQVEAEQAAKRKLELEIKKLRSQQAMYQRILNNHVAAGCSLSSVGTENNNDIYAAAAAQQPASNGVDKRSIAIAVKSAPVIVEAANAPYLLPMDNIAAAAAEPAVEQQPLIKPSRPQSLLGLSVSKPKSLGLTSLKEEEPETPSKGLFDGFITPSSMFGNIVPSLGTPTCSLQQRSAEGTDLNTPQTEGLSLTAL